MAVVEEIYEAMNQWAPFGTQVEYDNSGFLVGHAQAEVERVLVALDITQEVVEEAIERQVQLVISHHPLIFDPVRSVTDWTPTGELVLVLAEHGIAAICAHTNLDAAQGGVNCCLAEALELRDVECLSPEGVDEQGRTYGIGRVGQAHEENWNAADYAAFVKERLQTCSVRFLDCGTPVNRVAVGGGACAFMAADAAAAGCDTFVTSDVKYDQYLYAKSIGLNLMDAGHFATENVVCPAIAAYIQQEFPEVEVLLSEVHQEAYRAV